MIHYDRVTIQRGGQTLLDGQSLQISSGERAVVTGPSGSGKSSLLMALVGMVPISSGQISLDQTKLAPGTINQLRRLVGHIGQEPVLGAETVREALMLPFEFRANRHLQRDESKIRDVLKRLHLTPDILSKRCAVISGGEKQRIVICRAILLEKRVLLVDEATSALDPESKSAVLDYFANCNCTVLSVSHDPDWIEICSRSIELRQRCLREL